MSKRDDALDRYLDYLSAGLPSQPAAANLDAPVTATARRLLGMRRPEPRPAFLATLEADLAVRARSARTFRPDATPNDIGSLTGPQPTAPAPASGRGPNRPFVWLSCLAAVLVIIVGIGVLTLSHGDRDGNRLTYLPAAEATAPPPAAVVDCYAYLQMWSDAQTWLVPRYNRLLFAQIPSISRPSPAEPGQTIEFIPTSALPGGEGPSRITVAKINTAIAREYACAGTILPEDAGSMSDPQSSGADGGATHGGTDGGSAVGDAFVAVRPAQALQTVLDYEGRVGALVWDDGGETGTYFVFIPTMADWVPVEVAAVATDAYITAHPGAPLTDQVTISVNDVRVIAAPVLFDLAAGAPVDITVVNDGTRERQFSIPSAGIELTLAPGEQRTVTVTFPEGGHRYTVDVNANDNLTSGGWLWSFADVALPTPTISPGHDTDGSPGSQADDAIGTPSRG